MDWFFETILGGASALLYTCGCTTPERVAGIDVFAIGLQHLSISSASYRYRCVRDVANPNGRVKRRENAYTDYSGRYF